jgi:gliding motility-associated lipoprotein GldD
MKTLGYASYRIHLLKNKGFFILLTLLSQWSCSQDYSPKPSAYFHIHLPPPIYHPIEGYSGFEFDISDRIFVENVKDSMQTDWFNLNYPLYNAHIYCSYLPITAADFQTKAAESKEMAYFHAIKADGIEEYVYNNPEEKVYGLVYEIKGNVASPVQFVVTDSVRSFFRGALYFDNPPNQDSIAPVLDYINKDIHVILESFRWKR